MNVNSVTSTTVIISFICLCSSGSKDHEQLCVLHPLRLAVYSVSITEGVASRSSACSNSAGRAAQGVQAKLTPAYQHVFTRQAHSAVVGRYLHTMKCVYILPY